MRKLFVVLIALSATIPAFSQKTTTSKKKKFNLSGRAADHFLLQYSLDSWSGAADSVSSRIKTFSKGFNTYLMIDFPFKSSPKFSAALGLGVSTSGMMFKNTTIDIAGSTPQMNFVKADTINHYKKYKLATSYLELPIELRFTSDPEHPNKSVKVAIGMKVGTLLNAHTKGKTLLNGSGNNIGSFTQKVNSRSYFNSTKLAATARIGYGYISAFVSYNLTNIFKDNVAPNTKLVQIGLTLSGL
ncbi:MAG: outer membrane beta-barrel protein [Bacteroidetes bacterium]|jgi:hypothetical protein|nr:outer membrane beta-barrel protein [Bacteroidota bacterium]